MYLPESWGATIMSEPDILMICGKPLPVSDILFSSDFFVNENRLLFVGQAVFAVGYIDIKKSAVKALFLIGGESGIRTPGRLPYV